jgi:glycosyltransferase involved in cell wall biosynthesis
VVIGPSGAPENVAGIRIVPLRKSPIRLVRRLFAPFSALGQVLRLRPRIVHFHDPEILPVAVLLKLLGYKMVWDVHEYYSEVLTVHMRKTPLRAVKRAVISALVEKIPCAILDRSVFPTKALRAAIRDKDDAIACVNLLPVNEFPDIESNPDKEFDLIFVGSMSPFRAGPFMEMVALLRERRPGFRAAILGVRQATQTWMERNAPSKDVLDAITFLPRVPHSEVASALRRARIGFNYHPMEKRFQVALPMKVYEYMACGLPVICSRFPELAEQLSANEMVLVNGDDQQDYANAIAALLDDPERQQRMGRAGEAAVRDRLNWESSEAPKLVTMYRDLLG